MLYPRYTAEEPGLEVVHVDTAQSRTVSSTLSQCMLFILLSEAVSTVDGHLAPSAQDLSGTQVAVAKEGKAADGHLASTAPDVSESPSQTVVVATETEDTVADGHLASNAPDLSETP